MALDYLLSEDKETHQWIGFIGLNYIPETSDYPFKELPLYEIGWRLLPEFWGKGLATEGAKATLKLAEEHQIYDVIVLQQKQIKLHNV